MVICLFALTYMPGHNVMQFFFEGLVGFLLCGRFLHPQLALSSLVYFFSWKPLEHFPVKSSEV